MDTGQIISVASPVISLASLAYSFYLHRQIQKLQFVATQRETVLGLIKGLRSGKTSFHVFGAGSSHIIGDINGLDILSVAQLPDKQFTAECKVADRRGSAHASHYLPFLNDPCLPKPIADALRAFNSAGEVGIGNLDEEEVVVIGRSNDAVGDNLGELIHPLRAEAYKSWRDYTRSCRTLRLSIEGWFARNGIADANL